MNFCESKTYFKISSEKRNLFRLDLGYKTIDLTFCQLLLFRKKVLDLSSPASMLEIINGDNFVLMSLADNAHIIYLDVPQLLQLRTLVASVFNNRSVLEPVLG